MDTCQVTPFQRAIDAVESQPLDERGEILKILRLRAISDRRDQIAASARETLNDVREGKASFGTMDRLLFTSQADQA